MEVDAGRAAPRPQQRRDPLTRRARVGRRFEDHELAGAQHRAERLRGVEGAAPDPAHGWASAASARRSGPRRPPPAGRSRWSRADAAPPPRARCRQRPQCRNGRCDGVHPARIEVDGDDIHVRRRERHRQGQADVSKTDDADAHARRSLLRRPANRVSAGEASRRRRQLRPANARPACAGCSWCGCRRCPRRGTACPRSRASSCRRRSGPAPPTPVW